MLRNHLEIIDCGLFRMMAVYKRIVNWAACGQHIRKRVHETPAHDLDIVKFQFRKIRLGMRRQGFGTLQRNEFTRAIELKRRSMIRGGDP